MEADDPELWAWAADAVKYPQKYSHIQITGAPPQDPTIAALSLDELRKGRHGDTRYGTSPSPRIYYVIEYATLAGLAARHAQHLEREAKKAAKKAAQSKKSESTPKPAPKNQTARPTPTPITDDGDITG